ncbi:MAG: hypothetical protein ACE5KK_03330 [Candidatus Brocadiales bacterium]
MPSTIKPAVAISQDSLAKIAHLRRELQDIESWAKETKARLQAEEDQVIKALEDGLSIESGERTATVKVITKRIVAWKDAFIRHVSKAVADRLTAEAEPTVYKKLEIA